MVIQFFDPFIVLPVTEEIVGGQRVTMVHVPREFTVPLSNTMATALPIGVAHKTRLHSYHRAVRVELVKVEKIC